MMRLHAWPLCLVRFVPGDFVSQQVDAATGRTWSTRGQVRVLGLPVVSIAEGYRDDLGLMAHELEHVRQFWRGWAIGAVLLLIAATAGLMAGLPDLRWLSLVLPVAVHPMLYGGWGPYRLLSERDAYRAQMMLPDRAGRYLSVGAAAARLLSPSYDLRLTFDDALAVMEGVRRAP